MSDTPGRAGAQGRDEEFTVPVPPISRPSRATQALPVLDHTRELPVADPGWASAAASTPTPTNPYAGQPVWPAPVPSRTGGRTTTAAADPLIAQVGVALFWVAVGWWGFVVIRLLGHLSRFGVTDTMLIRTIDRGAEETIVAAGVSVLAAVLLVSVDRTRRAPLTIASVVLALVTVGTAVWRVLP
ncbi:hypothetical protein [Terrabacter sp. BE26]|uniref:hypothetical protein n=1 Tax=Terrabacter sp. BE26 TaxID=2898152 RepID=UPI0035BE71F7